MSHTKISKLSLLDGSLRIKFVVGSVLFLIVSAIGTAFGKEVVSPHGTEEEHAAAMSVVETAAQATALSPDGSVGPIMFVFMVLLLIVCLTIAGRISKGHFNRK